ncbi:YopX family protein [Salmonella enterica]|nr:YopX family protein [Salmonella enterica]
MIPKFRAWDKKLKKMFEVSYIDFDTKLIGLNIDLEIIIFDFEDIILMQSTGLKDKNGKEIFEGDILGFETDEGILNVNVFWDSKHALFMFESKIHNEEELLAELVENNTYPFEIVGNIYENPELLEVKL